MTHEEKRAYRRAWQKAHPERMRKAYLRYYIKNRDKLLAYQAEYRRLHKTFCDRKISELRALERHLRAFSNGADATEDVLEYLNWNEYFCKSDCTYVDETGGEITDENCIACVRARLNGVVKI